MHRLRSGKCAFPALALLLVVPGCGDGVNSTTLSGKVTYRSQPLANGTVTFYPERGQPVTAGLDLVGTYTVDLPPGTYQATVQGPGIQVPEGWKEGDPPPPPPKLVLPAEYSARARTKLQVTVAEGSGPQMENFELK